MAAIAYSLPEPWVTPRSDPPDRPFRVVQPVRRARMGGRVYRRRRAVALISVVAIALMATAVARMALAGSGGGALTSSGSSGATVSPAASNVYVVQPGDTLWSIAIAHDRGGDPRPEVDRLALELHGQSLLPGQRIELP